MDKNLPSSAGNKGSIPDLGRFHFPQSPAPQLLRRHSKAQGLQLRSPRALERVLRLERSPHAALREQPLLSTKRKPGHSSEDPG